MRIAIVYNEPQAGPTHRCRSAEPATDGRRDASEAGVLASVAQIEGTLRALGREPLVHGTVSGADLCRFLTRERPDVVFNCCESLRGQAALEMSVAAMFDLFGIAYTGSSALTLGLALDKGLAKLLFRASGIPTPPFVTVATAEDLNQVNALALPLIVKPVAEDASNGIDDASVVYDRHALAERVRSVWSTFAQPALVEEFIDGRELNVALLADLSGHLETLPISEVSFDELPPGMPPIVTYEAKWSADSPADRATPVTCPAAVDAGLAERVKETALAAARSVGLRDYGRVDIRVRSGDEAIFVLEVNPNPDLSVDAGFMRAAAASGRAFADTIGHIVSCASQRARADAFTSGKA